ncbi:MAG: hypothetical protein LC785_04045 [Acidobacteria bacterium]|nr:hypothetical protein [Acidobacteriota bacterium]MCA1641156.1 hypothetical protein [Acidobacteriota bacterium]
MPARGREERTTELQETLRELEARFEREMRARGFEPAQAETSALPSALASLYAEREGLRAELDELLGGED